MTSTHWKRNTIVISSLLLVMVISLTACGSNPSSEDTRNKHYTFGFFVTFAVEQNPIIPEVKAALAAQGYVEGENVTYVSLAETDPGDEAAYLAAVKELLTQDLDLILVGGGDEGQLVMGLTETIPIVLMSSSDPIGYGFAESLARPGKNITGIYFFMPHGKRLELLNEAIPDIQTVYLPYIVGHEADVAMAAELSELAPELGLDLVTFEAKDQAGLTEAYAAVPENTSVIFLGVDQQVNVFFLLRIGELTSRQIALTVTVGKPYLFPFFLGYGLDSAASAEQIARIVDQILHGTSPGDLPFEEAENSLVINLETAEALGITVPDTILRRANIIVRSEDSE